jgi:cbb3-type cytochrome oxidase maturation protein
MNVLVYLVPMALALGLTGLAAFLWSMRAGQYDDLEGAAMRVLSDDDVDWVNATGRPNLPRRDTEHEQLLPK